jgi:hypothetical protein
MIYLMNIDERCFKQDEDFLTLNIEALLSGPSKHTDYIHHVGMIFVNRVSLLLLYQIFFRHSFELFLIYLRYFYYKRTYLLTALSSDVDLTYS